MQIDQITQLDQDRLEDWFDKAMNDESVRPYLTTGVHFPRISLPEDSYDGAIFMNENNTGVIKLYPNEDSQTMMIGIWVLTPENDDSSRSVVAHALMGKAIEYTMRNPRIQFFSTRVMSTNYHGMNFSTRLLTQWGEEKHAVFDTSDVSTGCWVSWVHFRASIHHVYGVWLDWKRHL